MTSLISVCVCMYTRYECVHLRKRDSECVCGVVVGGESNFIDHQILLLRIDSLIFLRSSSSLTTVFFSDLCVCFAFPIKEVLQNRNRSKQEKIEFVHSPSDSCLQAQTWTEHPHYPLAFVSLRSLKLPCHKCHLLHVFYPSSLWSVTVIVA